MKKVFILSTAFFARTLMYNINYILGADFDSVILLKENHSNFDSFQYNVELYEDINDCIYYADYILIYQTEKIPQKTVNYTIGQAAVLDKVLIYLSDNCGGNTLFNYTEVLQKNKDIPWIFHVSIGEAPQSYCLETLINKILQKNNVNFEQYFTVASSMIVSQLERKKQLNPEFMHFKQKTNGRKDIIVCSYEVGNDENNLWCAIELCHDFCPDFLIIQTDLKYSSVEDVRNKFFYSSSTDVDLIINSRFYPYKDTLIAYCDELESTKSLFLDDKHLEEKIQRSIFSKISYPDGFYPL